MEAIVVKLLVAALCALVIVGSICRLDMLRAGVNRGEWIAIYTVVPIFAFGIIIDLATGRVVDWYEVAGIVGWALQLLATRELWTHETPPNTRIDAS